MFAKDLASKAFRAACNAQAQGDHELARAALREGLPAFRPEIVWRREEEADSALSA